MWGEFKKFTPGVNLSIVPCVPQKHIVLCGQHSSLSSFAHKFQEMKSVKANEMPGKVQSA